MVFSIPQTRFNFNIARSRKTLSLTKTKQTNIIQKVILTAPFFTYLTHTDKNDILLQN